MEIRAPKTEIEWEEYYTLRYKILRATLDQPLGSERNDGDKTGQHFALFSEGRIAAIARLDQAEDGISQVRFVAVDNAIRGKGFGRLIMEATEKASIEQGNHKMVLQARDYSVDFYLRLDYTLLEKTHLLFGVIQHYKMEKVY
ncbi:MAG: GNAT family N-acetyltransferase [Crocinitomicaceae bacterium]|nr:GNAT family N-acetyltransferase [Crocinitomicaceae bacterium]